MFTPWPYIKPVICCWTLPKTTLIYTKENMSEWSWNSRFPTNIFEELHFAVQRVLWWERRRRCYGTKWQGCWHRNVDIIILYWIFFLGGGKQRWRRENGQTSIFFLNIVLFGYKLKNSTHSLLGAWSFLVVHVWFTPSEGPKGFVNLFLRNWTIKVGPWRQTMEKGHLPWSDFMVHNPKYANLLLQHECHKHGACHVVTFHSYNVSTLGPWSTIVGEFPSSWEFFSCVHWRFCSMLRLMMLMWVGQRSAMVVINLGKSCTFPIKRDSLLLTRRLTLMWHGIKLLVICQATKSNFNLLKNHIKGKGSTMTTQHPKITINHGVKTCFGVNIDNKLFREPY